MALYAIIRNTCPIIRNTCPQFHERFHRYKQNFRFVFIVESRSGPDSEAPEDHRETKAESRRGEQIASIRPRGWGAAAGEDNGAAGPSDVFGRNPPRDGRS